EDETEGEDALIAASPSLNDERSGAEDASSAADSQESAPNTALADATDSPANSPASSPAVSPADRSAKSSAARPVERTAEPVVAAHNPTEHSAPAADPRSRPPENAVESRVERALGSAGRNRPSHLAQGPGASAPSREDLNSLGSAGGTAARNEASRGET